jgi:ankyrin repeat protein
MIYALSNAGADPNVPDGKGNTPLHEALIQGLANCGLDFIQVFHLTK